MRRREFLAAAGVLSLSQLIGARAGTAETRNGGQDVCGIRAEQLAPTPQIAISLKSFSEKLTQCSGGKSGFSRARCARLRSMDGMTRLDGIVVDRQNRDIVLWGIVEPGAPRLRFDDFVYSLRAAFGQYTIVKNGQRVRQAPAISLDADGRVFEALHEISFGTPDGERKYRQVCSAPMVVRVDGMPRHTELAKVLVDADFRMKLVSFGDVILPIRDPFPGASQRLFEQAFFNAKNGRPSQPQFNSNRMWFQPGSFSYQISQNRRSVFLDRAQVVLNDRATVVDASGNLIDGGPDSAFSRAFTCAWTERMEEVYQAEPVWRDMHNIYRHFAIADVIVRENLFEDAGFDASFLLETYRPERTKMPDTLPGHAKIFNMKDGTFSQVYTVCGGVSVGFHEDNLERRNARDLDQLAEAKVLADRPGSSETSWRL